MYDMERRYECIPYLRTLIMLQGLNWYKQRLKEDRDGDVAEEFLTEITRGSRARTEPLSVR